MTVEAKDYTVVVHEEQDLVKGQFDQGKIREVKPIGFPGEGSRSSRVGPLFYWAWASAEGYAKIPMHPHQGFEIMSYVLSGELTHSDSLGTHSRVRTGGAQIMRTGSGVSHQEETSGEDTQFLQIWFEPDLSKSLKTAPQYYELSDQDFPVVDQGGIRIKSVLGSGAPVTLVTDSLAEDIIIPSGGFYSRSLESGRSLAVLALNGSGRWHIRDFSLRFKARDFSLAQASKDSTISIQADNIELRLFSVEVPTYPGYPLYPSRR